VPVKKSSKAASMRPVKIQRSPLNHAEGSALITVGNTKVLCAASVEHKKPKWLQKEKQGWITAEYSLLPRSTNTRTRRERGNISGRTQEIQRLIGRSLRAVAELEPLDNYTVFVDCDVIQADGGTRTAAITGGFVALYDACRKMFREKKIPSFPIFDQVAAISVGIYDGELWLDLDYEHDFAAEVDMNVVMTGSGRIVEVQGTAEGKPFTKSQMNKMVSLAEKGIVELIAIQKRTLRIK
jgi:ribonuclease PH